MEGSDNLTENKDIKSVTHIDNGFIRIEYNEGKGKPLEIPEYIDCEKVPLIDSLSNSVGWFKMPSKIMDSYLTQNAKSCYCALRQAIIHNMGFTIINIEPTQKDGRCLMKFMSVNSHNTVDKALVELENFGLIKIGQYTWNRINKKMYILKPCNEWRLPSEEQAKKYQAKLAEEKRKKDEKRKKEKAEKEAKKKSGEFIFDKGNFAGMSMSEVYEIESDKVKYYAENGSTDELKQAAQKVLDDNFYCPEPEANNYGDNEEWDESIPI